MMGQELTYALQITAIGMSLVFGAILLLWALMAAIVKWMPEREPEEAPAVVLPVDFSESDASTRKRAAAVAVSIALAQQASKQDRPFPLPPTAIVSAWQAVRRANSLNQKSPRR